MTNFSTKNASTALELLADAATRRKEEFETYDTIPNNPDSDEDCDSPSPIYDSFCNTTRSKAILQMTNFVSPEFHKLWNLLFSEITSKYNVGRGRRSAYTAKDVLFMAVATAKHGGNWDFMGRTFGIKGPTFERIVSNFVRMFSDTVYHIFVVNATKQCTMKKLIVKGKTFKSFPFARYARDVTFQQTNRPSGNLQETKQYFSGKHKLYGCKVEVSVLPTGVAVGCSAHHPGNVSDLVIFYRNNYFHRYALKKVQEEKEIAELVIW